MQIYTLIISILLLSCSDRNIARSDVETIENIEFSVMFENFDEKGRQGLIEKLNQKRFVFQNNEILETYKNEGHSFITNGKSSADRLINVRKLNTDNAPLHVNIKFFRNVNNKMEQYFNPGNFNITGNNSDKKMEELSKTIIKLTFK